MISDLLDHTHRKKKETAVGLMKMRLITESTLITRSCSSFDLVCCLLRGKLFRGSGCSFVEFFRIRKLHGFTPDVSLESPIKSEIEM